MNSFICMLLGTCILIKSSLGNPCVESKAKSCSDCIALPNCAWCEYPGFADNPNVVISRCDLPDNLLAGGCPNTTLLNPHSSHKATKDSALSNVGESAVGKATQIRPQAISAKIRAGDPLKIRLSFKQAEDYPVDLYYLLDLSKSMKNDLQSLRALGQKLGDSMRNITRDFRLGFGSFVDKTVMPYISTVPSKLKNPCSSAHPCVPAYSFHNDLPLTSEITAFVNKVKNVTYSSNLDNPEGGLDAMMQAIVCQNQINWRQDATHLLVYSTDATFHFAGDGKLGGIVLPNDGQCYLNSAGHYTKANEMDYPSIGHLVKKISSHNIQPIFAVTANVASTYEKLQQMIPKSVVGELSEDSSNIIGLIQKAYNDLKGRVVLEIFDIPPEVKIVDKMAHCRGSSVGGLKCEGVKLGDVVNFTFSISVDSCLKKPVTLKVSPYGYNEVVNITLQPLCECDCSYVDPNNNCSGHGNYYCGTCVCDTGFTGLDCSCDQKDLTDSESFLVNCTDPVTHLVCYDRGECQCGHCICNQQPDKKIDGKYCECDNTTCDRVDGKICNNHGNCDCGTCKCHKGWTGKICECTLDETPCFDRSENAPNSSLPCNGNGRCECGKCECNANQGGSKYRGLYCQTSPSESCEVHFECLQCFLDKQAGGENYVANETCINNCKKYNISWLGDEGIGFNTKCRYTAYDDCSYTFWYAEKPNGIVIKVDEEKVCQTFVDPIIIIIAIIAAIVGIGLAILLIWKLLTSIKDAREYKNFMKDSQNPKWEGGENPIYKKATSTFRNPTYTGGKPSANL